MAKITAETARNWKFETKQLHIGQEDYEKWLRHMTQKYNPPIGRVVSKKSS